MTSPGPGDRLVRRLLAAQTAHPWLVLSLMALSLIPALVLSATLTIDSSMRDLLPRSKPSVQELDRLSSRLGGMGTLIVVVQGGNRDTHLQFIRKAAPRIAALGPAWVHGVDHGMKPVKTFLEDHWWAYVNEQSLRKLRDDLSQAKDEAVMKRAGLDLGLDDNSDSSTKWTADSLLQQLSPPSTESTEGSMRDEYVGDDGSFGAIVVRTPFGTGDDRVPQLEQRIGSIAADTIRDNHLQGLHVAFTGSLVTADEEHRAIVGDLAHVGVIGVGLILGIVFAYFLRFRALIAMTLTIAVGCAWSFAVARLWVGHLNSATGFLVSILAGNGINFGIIYMARYLEARHDDGLPLDESMRKASRETSAGTLTAACAASIAYGSLALSNFPGFRQFGLISGVGMLCCWAATYLFLPAILTASERLFPIVPRPHDWRRRTQRLFAGPLFSLARRAPLAVTAVWSVVVLAGAVAGVVYVVRDPMQYDLTRIRNDDSDPHSARALARKVAPVISPLRRDGRAMLVDRIEDVAPLVAELRARRDAAPPDAKPFGRVVSIQDLVPAHQQERVKLAREIVDIVKYARRRGFIHDKDWQKIASRVPDRVEPVTMSSLPEQVAWPFEEADGARGRIVYLVPTPGRSLNDARYLMLWADSFRTVRLPDGTVVHGSGDPVIFADVLLAVRREAPVAILASAIGTILVLLGGFRGRLSGWLALGSVVAGAAALALFFELAGVRLNFLNFMALPITIGVGADYAVNVMRRHDRDPGAAHLAFVKTGGAVMVCSLTTMLGYGALLTSINGAVRSFGLAAAAGEVVMILAATLLLPSVVLLRERARGRRECRSTAAEALGRTPMPPAGGKGDGTRGALLGPQSSASRAGPMV